MRSFVGLDAIRRCDFFGEKRVRCEVISITMRCDCHPWMLDLIDD